MQPELVLLFTAASFHLVLGAIALISLTILLGVLNRFTIVNTELNSWLWVAAFFVSVSIPVLFSIHHDLFIHAAPEATTLQSTQPTPPSVEQPSRTLVPQLPINLVEPQVSMPNSTFDGSSNTHLLGRNSWSLSSNLFIEYRLLWLAMLSVWVVGVGWRSTGLLQRFYQTKKIIDNAKKYALAPELYKQVPIKVLVSNDTRSPMVIGLSRPVIVVPWIITEKMPASKLLPILFHEQAHIHRKDPYVHLVIEFFMIFFWWSPLARLMDKKIKQARELACDVRAAGQLTHPKLYAQALLDCAQLMLTEKHNVLALSLFTKKKELVMRVDHVLNATKTELSLFVGGFSIVALLLVGTAVAAAVAPGLDGAASAELKSTTLFTSREKGEDFIFAAASGDVAKVEALIQAGTNVNTLVRGEGTALIAAARAGDLSMVDTLLSLGADPNLSLRGDGSPLIAAAQSDRKHIAEQLIESGANIDGVVVREGSPLIVAIRHKHYELAERLIELGADVNLQARWDGTPLIAAVINGHLPMVKRLVSSGAEIDIAMDTDDTALINAARRGDLTIIRYLVESGADVNLGVNSAQGLGTEYRTPLSMANHANVKDYLKENGAIH